MNIPDILGGLITRFGGAIEFWTVACMSQSELGDPGGFVDIQWSSLLEDLQTIRSQLAENGIDTSPVVQEQLAKLTKSCADLREVFDHFIHFTSASNKELERAVLRLSQLWEDFRMRISLLGVLLPMATPVPMLNSEHETYYQGILDGLFDRFEAARPKSVFDGAGGKV
jgi:hypothetical protein